jgi:hypothetical protein
MSPVMKNKYKPVTVTLPKDIVELVMTNCNDDTPQPQTQEEWNDLVAEIVEEYFNF